MLLTTGIGGCEQSRNPLSECAGLARKDWMKTFSAQMVGLLTGFGGLLAGLFLLDREPLFGVLSILGAMSLTLIPAAALCGTGVRPSAAEQKPIDRESSSCIDQ